MKRVAFTIVLNGMKHLLHNNYAEFILKNFDHWYVVEGVARSTGSTSWCREMPQDFHNNYHSIDGTLEYLQALTNTHNNLTVISREGGWDNKDCMVNAAAQHINKDNGECFVWELDVDEQWTLEDLKGAEQSLEQAKGKTGTFLSDYYVGKDLLAIGAWGEGKGLPYRRLWHWNKDSFHAHEPPMLRNGDDPIIHLPHRFKHYAYYFEEDVAFKDKWYGSQQGTLQLWQALQKETVFPQPISKLLPSTFYWSTTNTKIVKVP